VLQEIRRATSKKQMIRRDAKTDIRKILPKRSNEQEMSYDFVISFVKSLATPALRAGASVARLIKFNRRPQWFLG
jgi:hypothetical protein